MSQPPDWSGSCSRSTVIARLSTGVVTESQPSTVASRLARHDRRHGGCCRGSRTGG